MATLFSITTAAKVLRVDPQRGAECSYTVSNTSGRRLRGRAELKAIDPAQQAWLTLVGAPEREFEAGGTDQFSVKIAIPPGSPGGKYSFRLDVVSTENPDEDFTEGPAVSFDASPSAAMKAFPWWILVAAASAVVLIGLGVGLYFLLRPRPEEAQKQVPRVEGEQLEQAKKLLSDSGLKLGQIEAKLTVGRPEGEVLKQDPAADSWAPSGTEVQLETALTAVKIPPDAEKKSFEEAKTLLAKADLRGSGPFYKETRNEADDGKVVELVPPAGKLVRTGSEVEIYVARHGPETVPVPEVLDLNRDAAEKKIETAGLRVGEVDFGLAEPGAEPKVLKQDPGPGGRGVPRLTKVNLVVAEAGVRVPPVIGAIFDAAALTLRKDGLWPEIGSRTPAEKPQDTVLSQTPEATTLVEIGRHVKLDLALARVQVPPLKGMTLEQARKALRDKGLGVKELFKYTPEVALGIILHQYQEGLVAPDAVVEIAVNSKPGCDGHAGSGKVVDQCGVCGGNNVCLTACPAKTFSFRNRYRPDARGLNINLPKTNVGVVYQWTDVVVHAYLNGGCRSVDLGVAPGRHYEEGHVGFMLSCVSKPAGGVWEKTGVVNEDGRACTDFGNLEQEYLQIWTK